MAASSSATFFGLKEEEFKNHLNLQHSSGAPNSIMGSSASAAPTQRKKRNQPGTPSKICYMCCVVCVYKVFLITVFYISVCIDMSK